MKSTTYLPLKPAVAVTCLVLFSTIPGVSQINMGGTWQLRAASTRFNLTFNGTAQIGQSGSNLTGFIDFQGTTPCAAVAPFAGTLTGSQLAASVDESGQITVFTGTVASNGNSASGTYRAPLGGCTNGDMGNWTATRMAAGTPTPQAVVSAASYLNIVSPGSLVSVFGFNLASQFQDASNTPLPTTLGGATPRFNATLPVPMIAATPGQLNVQVPWELMGQTSGSLSLSVLGRAGTSLPVSLSPVAPAIFTLNQQGTGQGAIQIANTTIFAAPLNSVSGAQARPAARGEFITIFATGLGNVTNRPATGSPALADPLSTTVDPAMVRIGNVAAPVNFAGLAPGFVGLYQVNAQIPPTTPTGNAVPVTIIIRGSISNSVVIAVR